MDRLEPSKELRGKILLSIKREEIRLARIYVLGALSTMVISSLATIFAFKNMFQSFSKHSFYSYLSLLFSDPDIVFLHWKELSLSLIETVPLVAIIFLLVAVMILLTSMRVLANNSNPYLTSSFNN